MTIANPVTSALRVLLNEESRWTTQELLSGLGDYTSLLWKRIEKLRLRFFGGDAYGFDVLETAAHPGYLYVHGGRIWSSVRGDEYPDQSILLEDSGDVLISAIPAGLQANLVGDGWPAGLPVLKVTGYTAGQVITPNMVTDMRPPFWVLEGQVIALAMLGLTLMPFFGDTISTGQTPSAPNSTALAFQFANGSSTPRRAAHVEFWIADGDGLGPTADDCSGVTWTVTTGTLIESLGYNRKVICTAGTSKNLIGITLAKTGLQSEGWWVGWTRDDGRCGWVELFPA